MKTAGTYALKTREDTVKRLMKLSGMLLLATLGIVNSRSAVFAQPLARQIRS